MPIKNLTDTSNPARGIPKLGNIRPGEKRTSKSGAEYPANLDYWRVTFTPGHENLAESFQHMYGKQPREFAPVFVIGATVEQAFPTWMMAYNSSQTQIRKCDGESIVQMLNEKTGRYQSFEGDNCPACICSALAAEYEQRTVGMSEAQIKQVKKPLLCARRGWLNVILFDFSRETGMPGYFTVNTGSAANIATIHNTLAYAENMLGTLLKVPFVFGRGEPEERNVPFGDSGERRKVKESMFYMHILPAFNQAVVMPMLGHFDAPQLTGGYTTAYEVAPPTRQLPPVTAPNGYVSVEQVRVDWNEGDEFYTYTFKFDDDMEAEYTGDASAFASAGIDGPERWNPGEVITFEPPLQVKVKQENGLLTIASVKKYSGLATVNLPENPF